MPKTTKYKFVKYNKKTKDVRCSCKGQVMIDSEGYYEIPVGIGFHPGSNQCVVDKVRYFGYFGVCLKCNKPVFAWSKRELRSKVIATVGTKGLTHA